MDFKKFFCLHQYELLNDKVNSVMEIPYALHKCRKCGKTKLIDLATKKKNKYIFFANKIEDISDGSHTFKELYDHRMTLFSIICGQNKDIAWKSRLHHDGTMYSGYFIVGINTDKGDFSYHYKNEHYKKFKVKELEKAPKWDGHTSQDIDRLISLLNKEI